MESNYKNNSTKIYNAGLYLRLSREDESNSTQSQSIINQKDFLTRYAVENGFNIIDYYIDDGYSGTNYDRPDFKRLIADIEKGRINTVITKDLSRLGRDYIETGYYIEKYFPSKNVRYIAVNDGLDTYVENSNDITPFKAVINDMYAKDISKKVRTAKTTQKLKGEFIGSVAPYGYKKDEANKNKLVTDEETAVIVRRIFKMYINNMSMAKISKQLSLEKIPTPSASRNLLQQQQGIYKGLWNVQMIQRILVNPTYIGNLTQNRSKTASYKVNKRHDIPRENWIIIPNTHEAIVSEEDFNKAQILMSRKIYITKRSKSNYLLSGLIFCGDCKKPMTYSVSTKRNPSRYFVCSARKRYGKLGICVPKSIRESLLEDIVIGKIKDVVNKYLNKGDLITNTDIDRYTDFADNLNKEKAGIVRQLEEMQTLIINLYKDKVKNIVSEEHFITLSREFSGQQDRLKERINQIDGEINQMQENQSNISSVEKYLKDFLKFDNVDRLTLVTLVNRIEVYRDKTVTIKFNFFEP